MLGWVALNDLNKCSAQISCHPSAVSWCNHPVAVAGGRPSPRGAVSLGVNVADFLQASDSGHRWFSGGNGSTGVVCGACHHSQSGSFTPDHRSLGATPPALDFFLQFFSASLLKWY